MGLQLAALVGHVTKLPTAKYVFVGLIALLLVIAVGHLYALRELTAFYLGLPLWVWAQLAVVTIMLVVAWIAVELVTKAGQREA